ncbi:MAG: pilus assembly protein CpaB [Gracilibacter sp. BRH_c7a]|nr:MAG: pilus assembly protein CpaB [Gracilibacter sp. BRH_c7a]
MKRNFYVFMALFSAIIFSVSLFYYLQNMDEPVVIETKPIVIAKADIPARSIIQMDQLEIINIPAEGYPQGGISTIEEVAGNVLLVNTKKGDWMIVPMLEIPSKSYSDPFISYEGFSLTVPEGKRAVAVPVGLIGSVGYKVRPGDRVDVLVTIDIREEAGTRTITSLAAQDILVLNTGFQNGSTSEETLNTDSCILALTVPQAMSITLGSERGSIRLILRNPVNKEMYTETPIDPSVYFDSDYFSHY